MVLAFCEDGVLELRGEGPIEGRSAIAAFIAGVGEPPAPAADAAPVRRIVRHSVTNVRFVSVEPTEARVESYFTVITEIGLDHLGRYRDVLVPAGEEWLIKRRQVSRLAIARLHHGPAVVSRLTEDRKSTRLNSSH